MRGAWSTLALVAVALGLGAYIYFVESKKPDTEAKEKVFAVENDAVEELKVVSKGDTSVLKKGANGVWALVEPLATDADANEVGALLSSLSTLEFNREVEAKAADLAQYGLAAPKTDITFTAKGGQKGRLRLGDQTPTGSDTYALKGDDPRVFLVSTFAETALVRSSFDLRDKRVLRFERDKADGLELTTAAGTTALARKDSEWRVGGAAGARGDYGAIEGLLTRLSTTMMSAIETTDVSDLAKYGLDTPVATVVVKAASASATLAVGKTADGKAFARDLARAMVFTIDAAVATELQKSGDDYRKKDVFDLRPFSARQLVITRGADTVTLDKKTAAGGAAADTWTVTGPGTTAAREAKTELVDDLLTKLTALRAQAFVTAAAKGAAPTLKVSAQFDENKKEEASFARAGEEVFAARADEAGAMRLDSAAFDEAVKAFDAVLAPPAPAPAAAAPSAAGVEPAKQP